MAYKRVDYNNYYTCSSAIFEGLLFSVILWSRRRQAHLIHLRLKHSQIIYANKMAYKRVNYNIIHAAVQFSRAYSLGVEGARPTLYICG